MGDNQQQKPGTGGRPRLPADQRRTWRRNIRLTEAAGAKLEDRAAAAGLSVSEFIQYFADDLPLPRRRTGFDPALVTAINRIGVNVNQLARAHHRGSDFVKYWKAIGNKIEEALVLVTRAYDS